MLPIVGIAKPQINNKNKIKITYKVWKLGYYNFCNKIEQQSGQSVCNFSFLPRNKTNS